MSTTYVPFAFYGCYFSSEDDAQAFLAANATDHDGDCVYSQQSGMLGLQYLDEDSVILGFALQPGESDALAKALWAKRFQGQYKAAQSHFALFTY